MERADGCQTVIRAQAQPVRQQSLYKGALAPTTAYYGSLALNLNGTLSHPLGEATG